MKVKVEATDIFIPAETQVWGKDDYKFRYFLAEKISKMEFYMPAPAVDVSEDWSFSKDGAWECYRPTSLICFVGDTDKYLGKLWDEFVK